MPALRKPGTRQIDETRSGGRCEPEPAAPPAGSSPRTPLSLYLLPSAVPRLAGAGAGARKPAVRLIHDGEAAIGPRRGRGKAPCGNARHLFAGPHGVPFAVID